MEAAAPIVDESVATGPFERPTFETDPGACGWCFEEAVGGAQCPYHGERAQTECGG